MSGRHTRRTQTHRHTDTHTERVQRLWKLLTADIGYPIKGYACDAVCGIICNRGHSSIRFFGWWGGGRRGEEVSAHWMQSTENLIQTQRNKHTREHLPPRLVFSANASDKPFVQTAASWATCHTSLPPSWLPCLGTVGSAAASSTNGAHT